MPSTVSSKTKKNTDQASPLPFRSDCHFPPRRKGKLKRIKELTPGSLANEGADSGSELRPAWPPNPTPTPSSCTRALQGRSQNPQAQEPPPRQLDRKATAPALPQGTAQSLDTAGPRQAVWVRVLREGRGRRPRQGLQLRRAWPGKDRGRPSVRSRGPGSQTALLGPWGRPR